MGEKEQGYLDLSPGESDYRLLIADKLLTEMPSERRINILKEIFLTAAKNHKDESAHALLEMIGKEYYFQERKIADETDKHYGNAAQRSDKAFGDYLREVYWELPDKKQVDMGWSDFEKKYTYTPTLLKIKAYILKVCVSQWASCDGGKICFAEVDEESKKIFRFLIDAYRGLEFQRYVSKEEHEEILKLFSEKTDSYFTSKIAEKWLSWEYSAIPEEIQKIFLIARVRNGGMDLFKRDMKSAEILKPLDVPNRSEAALEFHQKFCVELVKADREIKRLAEELNVEVLKNAVIKIDIISLDIFELNIYFNKCELPWKEKIIVNLGKSVQIMEDIYSFLSKRDQQASGRRVEIRFVFWDGKEKRGYCDKIARLK